MTLQLPSISQEVEHEPQHEGFEKIGKTAFAIAAVFAVAATAISVYTMWLHIKNYKNPSQQRQIIRILWMVPIYAISSWISLANKSIADYIETVRDMYEAFVIYVFFNLLISYLGGERELLVNLKRRPPTAHMFPVNLFSKEMNVGHPDTFVSMKRGILQFVFLKPIFSFLTLAMKSSDVYQEGFISVSSGYVWVTFLYNISVSVSMYCLVIFFFATRKDLDPYRPVPKFLCIKAIIFFSFWQGVVISVLVYLGVIREAGSYSADNIARALQDFLICLEMVAAAYGHWKAFNHSEYLIDEGVKLSARMSVPFAMRDSIGLKDVVCDFRHTIRGTKFYYHSAAEALLHRLSENQRTKLERFLARLGIRRKFGQSGRVVTVHGPGYFSVEERKRLDKLKQKRNLVTGRDMDHMNDEEQVNEGEDNEGHNESTSLLGGQARPSYTAISPSTSNSVSVDISESTPYQTRTNTAAPSNNSSSSLTSPTTPFSPDPDSTVITEPIVFSDINPTSEIEDLYRQSKLLVYGDYNYPVMNEEVEFEYMKAQMDNIMENARRRSLGRFTTDETDNGGGSNPEPMSKGYQSSTLIEPTPPTTTLPSNQNLATKQKSTLPPPASGTQQSSGSSQLKAQRSSNQSNTESEDKSKNKKVVLIDIDDKSSSS